MGCVVNGPGEAREADLGIAAGNKRGHLFVKGRKVVKSCPRTRWSTRWSSGPSSSTSTASTPPSPGRHELAEREAQRDRAALLDEQGDDANHAQERIVEIRKTVSCRVARFEG